MMTAAACLWLGLFPLLQGGTYSRITLDKWIIMVVLTGVTLICFFADLFRSRTPRKRFLPSVSASARLPLLLGVGLLCWILLSCLFTPYGPEAWWIGMSVRREGLATQLCYLMLFFLFALSRVRYRPILISAAAGTAVFFVIVMLQRSGGNPLGLYPPGRSYLTGNEFQGTIGNIDMGTGYLCMMAALFLTAALPDGWMKRSQGGIASAMPLWFRCVLLTGFGLSAFLIVTMDVQFGLITLSALLFATALRFLPRKLILPIIVLTVIAVLLVVWFWPGNAGGIWELHEIMHGRPQLSFGSNRIAVWLYSLKLAGDRLLFGGGPDTFVTRFNRFLEDSGYRIPTAQGDLPLPSYFDNPHNEYLSQLLNHGLPAMLLYILLIASALFLNRHGSIQGDRGSVINRLPFAAGVFCYALQAFFSFPVCIVAPMFWVMLGLSCGERKGPGNP